jgi:hypothetical protein
MRHPLGVVGPPRTGVAVTVRAFETAQTAEFANKRDLVKELTLEELELIAVGGTPPRLLTIGPR